MILYGQMAGKLNSWRVIDYCREEEIERLQADKKWFDEVLMPVDYEELKWWLKSA